MAGKAAEKSAVRRRRRRTTPICIWFGFPDRAFTCAFPEDCYTSGISQRYYELGGPAAGNRRADFFYYDVPSSQMCDLGWYTVFRGQEFLICEKWAKLERGELLFTYQLGKPGLGYGRKEYNDKISGMTILGEVLSTKRETVCLKLDIDEGWSPGGPYPYTWRPETGNMMYCMPQVGTRVSLYFPSCDEQAAIAVNCVRTNGSSCARMSDPSRRSFVTEHGKEMNLYPREMSFLGGANGTVKLEDETGITISTDKKIRIIAKQSVLVNGKTLAVSAPAGELVLAKGNALSGSIEGSMIQSSQYDLLAGSHTHMEGWNQQTFEAYDDAPQEGSFDWGGLIGNVLAGIAVAAVVGLAVASSILFLPATIALISGTAIASGTMIAAGIIGGVATAAGTIATVGKAIDDVQSGQVSDRKTYINTSYNAAATTGAVLQMLYGSYHLAKFLSQSPQIITNLAKFLSSVGNSGGSLTPAFATAEISGRMGSVGGTATLEIGAILIGESVGSLVAGLGSTVAGIMMFASDKRNSGGGSGSTSGNSLKKIRSNKEANRIARELEYEGAEELKADFVSDGAKFNMMIDTQTGEIVLVSIKNSSIMVRTSLYIR